MVELHRVFGLQILDAIHVAIGIDAGVLRLDRQAVDMDPAFGGAAHDEFQPRDGEYLQPLFFERQSQLRHDAHPACATCARRPYC
jgi:hypothetical protein